MAELIQVHRSVSFTEIDVYNKLSQLCPPGYSFHSQHDARIFLKRFIQQLNKYRHGLKTSNDHFDESTSIHQIFGGSMCSSLKCLLCNKVSFEFHDVQGCTLSPIKMSLENHFESILMDAKCKYCKETKPNQTNKKLTLNEIPAALWVRLERFEGTNGSMNKFMPKEIDFSKYSNNNVNVKYLLVSMVMVTHQSLSEGDHYRAISGDELIPQNDEANPCILFYELQQYDAISYITPTIAKLTPSPPQTLPILRTSRVINLDLTNWNGMVSIIVVFY